jgi:hypothetical protein
MTIRRIGDWNEARIVLAKASPTLKVAIRKALFDEAKFFKEKIIEGFETQAPGGQRWQPIAESTKASRRLSGFGGTKAGIVTGDLLRSVEVKSSIRGFFAGVPNNKRSKSGRRYVDILRTFTQGATIVQRVTPAQRRFLAVLRREQGSQSSGAGGNGSIGILVIKIPKRPLFAPIQKKYGGAKSGVRVMARISAFMKGAFGLVGPIHRS